MRTKSRWPLALPILEFLGDRAVNDSLQQEARALGDPTRHRIFQYIADHESPVTVAELTEYVGLNHNAVRQHLAVLKDANLVVEEREERDRPGRPRLLYRLHPEVLERWGAPGAYPWLANLLAAALRNQEEPRLAGREEGLRRAAEIHSPGTDSAALLEAEMLRRGFRPTLAEQDGRLEFILGRCPFVEVARSDPGTVCQLHLGLVEGLAEGLGGLEVEELLAKDPGDAGCLLALRRKGGREAGARSA